MRPLDRLRPGTLWATLRWPFRLLDEIRARRRSQPSRLVVAVDGRPLGDPLAGVGWYLTRLLESVARTEGLAVRLYGPGLADARGPEPRELPQGPAIELVRYVPPDDLSLPQSWLAAGLKLASPLLVAMERPDLVFAPNFVPPRSLRLSRAPLCVLMHDMAWYDLPGTLREETRADLGRHLPPALERAGSVITVTAAIKQRLVDTGLVAPETVHVVAHGPGHLVDRPSEDESASGEEGPRPEPNYALCVGTLEPRKNIATLLEAWRGLQAQAPPDDRGWPRLVLCGAPGWKSEELQPALERGREEGWLEVTGRVSDRRLDAYYDGALLAVCASLHEGFGLPLVEAMSLGVPLVVSDIAVFREVAADAARFVDPIDPDAWIQAVAGLTTDASERARLTEAGRRRASDFAWARTARQTLDVWRETAKSEDVSTGKAGSGGTR